jgi:hypothetical protein
MENEKVGFLENIRLWWKFEGRYYHKDFVNGVKNLIRWFPVIWKDRDWDDHFIWELMMKKITFQAKYIGDQDRHTRAKRDAEIMMTCVRLMERVKEEYYGTEYIDYHETKHEFVDCDVPGHKCLETTELSENFDEYFKKYPRLYKKILSENPNESKSRIGFLMSMENHKKAKRILFRLMEQYIGNWWD